MKLIFILLDNMEYSNKPKFEKELIDAIPQLEDIRPRLPYKTVKELIYLIEKTSAKLVILKVNKDDANDSIKNDFMSLGFKEEDILEITGTDNYLHGRYFSKINDILVREKCEEFTILDNSNDDLEYDMRYSLRYINEEFVIDRISKRVVTVSNSEFGLTRDVTMVMYKHLNKIRQKVCSGCGKEHPENKIMNVSCSDICLCDDCYSKVVSSINTLFDICGEKVYVPSPAGRLNTRDILNKLK